MTVYCWSYEVEGPNGPKSYSHQHKNNEKGMLELQNKTLLHLHTFQI
jgi:hypothetical protein